MIEQKNTATITCNRIILKLIYNHLQTKIHIGLSVLIKSCFTNI